eukprot:237749_1
MGCAQTKEDDDQPNRTEMSENKDRQKVENTKLTEMSENKARQKVENTKLTTKLHRRAPTMKTISKALLNYENNTKNDPFRAEQTVDNIPNDYDKERFGDIFFGSIKCNIESFDQYEAYFYEKYNLYVIWTYNLQLNFDYCQLYNFRFWQYDSDTKTLISKANQYIALYNNIRNRRFNQDYPYFFTRNSGPQNKNSKCVFRGYDVLKMYQDLTSTNTNIDESIHKLKSDLKDATFYFEVDQTVEHDKSEWCLPFKWDIQCIYNNQWIFVMERYKQYIQIYTIDMRENTINLIKQFDLPVLNKTSSYLKTMEYIQNECCYFLLFILQDRQQQIWRLDLNNMNEITFENNAKLELNV